MKVELRTEGRRLHYQVLRDDDEPEDGETFLRRADRRLSRQSDRFVMELPQDPDRIHPDIHATALWLMVHPFVRRRLELPFGVSPACAESLAGRYGVEVGPVDAALPPRVPPATPRPALLFSGGLDSMAASLLLPAETVHLFQDRIPLAEPPGNVLVDLVQQRRLCRARAAEREVQVLRDGHECLFANYPFPHTLKTVLPALYLADALGLGWLDTGTVMSDGYFQGYFFERVAEWRFRDPGPAQPTPSAPPRPAGPGPDHATDEGRAYDGHLAAVGLGLAKSFVGLSEVATALTVFRSPYRGRTYSCFARSFHGCCLACDKCFRKLLLEHVFADVEVPPALVDHFLRVPHLAAGLTRPFFEFHEVWTYLLQRVRCRHPAIAALQQQAQAAPDVGFLARWYPPSAPHIPDHYRADVVARIEASVGAMSPAEVQALARLTLPPFRGTGAREVPDGAA